MAYVKMNSMIPVPHMYNFSGTKHSEISCRYILMEAMPGCAGTSILEEFIPDEYKPKTYAQIADIKIQLSKLQVSKDWPIKRHWFRNG
jgi:hypothetical protein